MSFAMPRMFWLLLLLVVPLIGFYWWAWRKRQSLMTQFISSRLLRQLKVGVSPQRQKIRMGLLVLAVLFLVIALARPQWGVTQSDAHQRGLDVIVAIDTSNSMLAEDTPPNRLARAKLAALDLMKRAHTDRLGLVAFAGSAFLECPLTLDDAAFSQSVNALDTKSISQGGTAIADAIEESLKAFKESDNHKVLVMFTDGEDWDGGALAAAEKASKAGMVIFTIGIGSVEGELLRVRDDQGHLDYIRDEKNEPVKSHLNEELLKGLASVTKGFYLPLRGTKTMDTLYDNGIAPLPKSETAAKIYQRRNERYHWPLGIAILLLVWETFFPERKRRNRKLNQSPTSTRLAIIALSFILQLPAHASPSSALREYNAGKYSEALKDYNALLDKKKDDYRLHFNAGTAAYQSQQFEEAEKQFNEALTSPDLALQQSAYYNLANTLYRQGQKAEDADKKQAAWENAVKSYENALKLNPRDADAKFNDQFVQKQLEELKKQQQQQQQNQSDKNKKSDKDQKDQQNQSKDQQSKNDQQDKKDSQDQKEQQQQSQNQKQSDSQKKKEQTEKQKQDSAKADQEKQEAQKKQQAEQQAEQSDEKTPEQAREEAKKEAEMMAEGKMVPSQAKQLLDSQKAEDRVFQFSPTNRDSSTTRPFKNY